MESSFSSKIFTALFGFAGTVSHSIFRMDTEDETMVYGVAEYKTADGGVVIDCENSASEKVFTGLFFTGAVSTASFFLNAWSTKWFSGYVDDAEEDSVFSTVLGTRETGMLTGRIWDRDARGDGLSVSWWISTGYDFDVVDKISISTFGVMDL